MVLANAVMAGVATRTADSRRSVDDAEFEGERTEFIAAGGGVLLDQADAGETGEIGMRLGR